MVWETAFLVCTSPTASTQAGGVDLDAVGSVFHALLGVAITLSTMFVKNISSPTSSPLSCWRRLSLGRRWSGVSRWSVRPQAHHEAGAQVPKKLFFVAALGGSDLARRISISFM